LIQKYHLNFYGGEPLLAFDLIKKTLALLDNKNKDLKKNGIYSLTTNGSLLNKEICQFLNTHKFSVELSFDGLAQETNRHKGSFIKTISKIEELLEYPDIDLEINSVFTSETVDYLSESMALILDLGVPNINLSLSTISPWDQDSLLRLNVEITKSRKIVLSHYKKEGLIPLDCFKEDQGKGIFHCMAGKDRLAITPGGHIWGCYVFPDYLRGKEKTAEYKKFDFGNLDDFIQNHERKYPNILSNYAQLSMDNFFTPHMNCLFCSELEYCTICPVNAAFSSFSLCEIPHYMCEIQKIKIKQKRAFRKDIQYLLR